MFFFSLRVFLLYRLSFFFLCSVNITFIDLQGNRYPIKAKEGLTLLQVAREAYKQRYLFELIPGKKYAYHIVSYNVT